MVSDEEIAEFIEWCGLSMPDPDHEPRRFAYYVRLWKYYKQRQDLSCNKE